MDFARLSPPTLKEMFVKELLKRILSGRMSVGEWLPKERELAKQMQVSRSVVNDGIIHLARMGFLEVVPRKGAYVADYTMTGTMEAIKAVLDHNGGKFDSTIMNSAYEMRDNLDTHIVKLAAARRSDQDLADLRVQIDKLEDIEDIDALAEETFTLYHLLSRASGNILCPIQLYNKKFIYVALLRIIYQHADKGPWLERARHLVDLIEAKDSDAAVKFVFATSLMSWELIKKHYANEQASFEERFPAWNDIAQDKAP